MKIKSFVIFVLILTLITAFPAFANTSAIEFDQNFSIRGGIGYHTSKEQVYQIEENNGSTIYKDGGNLSDEETYGQKETDISYSATLLADAVSLFYFFNDDNEVEEFKYLSLSSDTYNNMLSALNEKYGMPLFKNGSEAPFSTNAKTIVTSNLANKYDYNGWLLKYNDCYALIEAVKTYASTYVPPTYTFNYTFISYETMEQMNIVMNMINDSIEDSIKNDI